MKLKFKIQPYQTEAVDSVVECFTGQPPASGVGYRMDPGRNRQGSFAEDGFRNAEIAPEVNVLANVQAVQKRQNLIVSETLVSSDAAPVNLDIEMETGTGKTYCYIKTMFELNERYGWSKFIVMVPSIAIREGVHKSLEVTAEHFTESYGKKARFFIYNSKRLHELESFSSDAGINVMVINVQAFNATGADNRRIYEELDDFQSRKPIDVIAANRPILILDEPQKMEGTATRKALPKFNALFCLRYSATHKTEHNKVHRLDAVDAYREKLVKKISVSGIRVRGITGIAAYLHLNDIEISKQAPVARLEFQVRQKSGTIKPVMRRVRKGDDLHALSNELPVYEGFTVSDIDARSNTVEFTNGETIKAGEATGDITEGDIRRIQIRETIRVHLEREAALFGQGIKVLSLFFIDEVKKYRDYRQDDTKGDYARIFEEEYERLRDEVLGELPLENEAYRKHLEGIDTGTTHNGYFSIDKKGHMADPKVKARGEGLSDDVSAYDLILKDKERLLSFEEPTRFIFSHSALREGWDNPNVFVMCMLKHSDNTVSRRQEVGRGLRISVDRHGHRVDDPAIVHDINVLTVVASESYQDFVDALQKETVESLSSRPRFATVDFFKGKLLESEDGPVEMTGEMATLLHRYLIKNDYTEADDSIASAWHEARKNGTPQPLPEALAPYADAVFALIDSVFTGADLPEIGDGKDRKTNTLNANFKKQEFQELWERINRKAVYRVDFSSEELVPKCVAALDKGLRVTPLKYLIERGSQSDSLSDTDLREGVAFDATDSDTQEGATAHSAAEYDLLQKISEAAELTRATVAKILTAIEPAIFGQFRQNPEQFITEASKLIREQKATMMVEKLSYDALSDRHDASIFTVARKEDFSRAVPTPKNHIYDFLIPDAHSTFEKGMASELEKQSDVVVYAKLPSGFKIPTPVGSYNPDWAIAFSEGSVKHVYFVAETKGTLESLKLRGEEEAKIACARKFFKELARHRSDHPAHYDVVTTYDELMDIVAPAAN